MTPSTRKAKVPLSLFLIKDSNNTDSTDEEGMTEQQDSMNEGPHHPCTISPEPRPRRRKANQCQDDQSLDSNQKPSKVVKHHQIMTVPPAGDEPPTDITFMEGIMANEHQRDHKDTDGSVAQYDSKCATRSVPSH